MMFAWGFGRTLLGAVFFPEGKWFLGFYLLADCTFFAGGFAWGGFARGCEAGVYCLFCHHLDAIHF